jgi:hypothetical protein
LLEQLKSVQEAVMNTLRTAFLSLHVAGGVLGLVVGLFSFQPPQTIDFRLWLRRLYAAAVGVLAVFLVALVTLDWSSLGSTPRIVFVVLIGLAAVIVARLVLAFRLARQQPPGWQTAYMNHIYFSYISLWEGFFIVGLIDLGAPAWLVGAVAVGVLVVGGIAFNTYKHGITPKPMTSNPDAA